MGLEKERRITGKSGYGKGRGVSRLAQKLGAADGALAVGADSVAWADVDWTQLVRLVEVASSLDMMVTLAKGFEGRWYSLTVYDHGDKERLTADNASRFDERVAILLGLLEQPETP